MIARVTLLNTSHEGHPMVAGAILDGYSAAYPVPGYAMIVWFRKEDDSSYMRTSPVSRIENGIDKKTGKAYVLVETKNSVYRLDELVKANVSEAGIKTNQEGISEAL